MYYIYHIPSINKIGATNNLYRRVTKEQGFLKNEYEVLFSSLDINEISNKEIELQKKYNYKIDQSTYKNVIDMKSTSTTTFYYPKKEMDKTKLPTSLKLINDDVVEVTDELSEFILNHLEVSMYGGDQCFVRWKHIYNFINNNKIKVFDNIRQWAKEKGILDSGDSKTQYIKLQEESGELAKALLNKDREEIIDAIGDIVVVLTNLAELENLKIEDCIDSAYNVIKERTGTMRNGTFVKNE